jgi:hypothetical protein
MSYLLVKIIFCERNTFFNLNCSPVYIDRHAFTIDLIGSYAKRVPFARAKKFPVILLKREELLEPGRGK